MVLGGNRADIVRQSVKKSFLWNSVTKLHLTENMRVGRIIAQHPQRETELRHHAQWLLNVGVGALPRIDENVIEQVVEVRQEDLVDVRSILHSCEGG